PAAVLEDPLGPLPPGAFIAINEYGVGLVYVARWRHRTELDPQLNRKVTRAEAPKVAAGHLHIAGRTIQPKRLSPDPRSKLPPALQGAVVPPHPLLGIPIAPPPSDQPAGGPSRGGRHSYCIARLVLPRNGRQHGLAALDGHLDRRYCQAFLAILERQLV